jgi:hypothetical protein
MRDPDLVDEVAHKIAPQADMDVTMVLRGTRRVQQQIEAAIARSGG